MKNRIISLQNIKSGISILILASSLLACNRNPEAKQSDPAGTDSVSSSSSLSQNDTLDAVVKSILGISAHDFYKNQQPLPVAFRNVQIRYSIKPNKEVLYILCGEFSTGQNQNKEEWTHFTTIRNSDYEQWIGPNGITYCENSTEIPYTKSDLSGELLKRFQSESKGESRMRVR